MGRINAKYVMSGSRAIGWKRGTVGSSVTRIKSTLSNSRTIETTECIRKISILGFSKSWHRMEDWYDSPEHYKGSSTPQSLRT